MSFNPPKPPPGRRILIKIPLLGRLFRYRVRFKTVTSPKFVMPKPLPKVDLREILTNHSVKERYDAKRERRPGGLGGAERNPR